MPVGKRTQANKRGIQRIKKKTLAPVFHQVLNKKSKELNKIAKSNKLTRLMAI